MDEIETKLVAIEDMMDDLSIYKPITNELIINLMLKCLITIHTRIEREEYIKRPVRCVRNPKVIEAYWNMLHTARSNFTWNEWESLALDSIVRFVYKLREKFVPRKKRIQFLWISSIKH